VIRFGGIPGIKEVTDPAEKKALMAKKMRADDEACFRLWEAFQANAHYRRTGTFLVVNQSGGAIFVGPELKTGTVWKSHFLNRIPPTLARILGFEVEAFFKPSEMKPRAPIEGIFAE
jgi:hypothetical protein